jgi:bis(5'-adenosyl)-triphosphatase
VLPGHVVVVPRRPVTRLAQLTDRELVDLFSTVRASQQAAGAFESPAPDFNIAIHDGETAGQPVPHVHCHVVPRRPGDLAENDMVYTLLQGWAPAALVPPGSQGQRGPALQPPPDEMRQPRTEATMAAEAASLAAMAVSLSLRGVSSPALPTSLVPFGRFQLDPSQVFLRSDSGLTIAIVNLKPLCEGHVLVVPSRVVARMEELSADELADLWYTVREVQEVTQATFGARGGLLGVQDGRSAGQSVPHVHVHVLPR